MTHDHSLGVGAEIPKKERTKIEEKKKMKKKRIREDGMDVGVGMRGRRGADMGERRVSGDQKREGRENRGGR